MGKGAAFKSLDASHALDCGGSCTSRANLAAALLRAFSHFQGNDHSGCERSQLEAVKKAAEGGKASLLTRELEKIG